MDANQFDQFTADIAEEETSRRSVVVRLAGGAFAAALAAFGIDRFDASETEAARRGCRRRCRKRKTAAARRRCRRNCRRPRPTGFPITNVTVNLLNAVCTPAGGQCGNPGTTGLECVGLICVPVDVGDVCLTGADCDSGRCTAGLCAICDAASICGQPGEEECCVVDADCIADVCVLPTI